MRRIGLLLCLLLVACQPMQDRVCVKDACFDVEVADTPEKRAQGLMHKDTLEGGMLFVFEQPKKAIFWMKNTTLPLDMIWIHEGKVLHIEKNVQPCFTEMCPLFGPPIDASYVLEINAGASEGMAIGDAVSIMP